MLDEKSLDLMKRMMEAFGPSGFEREVNALCKEYMEPYYDDVVVDKLGTVTFVAKGKSERPRVLMAGHTDEVGFIISSISKEGFLTFNALGGWWSQVLLGQRVVIRTCKGYVDGVIASKPPHILPAEERKKVVEREDMFIDIGATSKEEAEESGVKIGDPVVPYSPFKLVQDGRVAMGKAFDDRIGAFVIMEAIRRIKEQEIEIPNTVYGAATVQEETGLRGAQTIAHIVDPDVAIVIEVDIAGDVPGIKPHAEIPLQLSQISGSTDAGRIHVSRAGCPSVVVSVPTRHIHSHVGYLSLEDTENAIRLVIELLKRLDAETVEGFTAL
jgi:endoglucanase